MKNQVSCLWGILRVGYSFWDLTKTAGIIICFLVSCTLGLSPAKKTRRPRPSQGVVYLIFNFLPCCLLFSKIDLFSEFHIFHFQYIFMFVSVFVSFRVFFHFSHSHTVSKAFWIFCVHRREFHKKISVLCSLFLGKSSRSISHITTPTSVSVCFLKLRRHISILSNFVAFIWPLAHYKI